MPILAGPSFITILRATACAAPSPPPSPLAPVPLEINRTSVRLAWEIPHFDGSPSIYYELQSCGDLRNNGEWAPVFPPSYPKVVSQPVNLPHRVPGLGLRYRVRASNHGGWGEFSLPSGLITTPSWLLDTAQNAAEAMESLVR